MLQPVLALLFTLAALAAVLLALPRAANQARSGSPSTAATDTQRESHGPRLESSPVKESVL